MMREQGKWTAIVVVFLLVGAAVSATADDVADQIKQGLEQYQAGQYSQAVQSLQFATTQIQQKQAEMLKEIFPAPMPGWTAEEASGEFTPMAMMGGGVTASRKYSDNAGQEIDIDVVTNSPMLQSVMMFMSNPMFLASQPGAKLVKIKGYQAVRKFSSKEKDGEVSVVIQNKMLVTVKGSGLKDDKPLMDYAEKIDFAALEKFLTK